MRNLNLKTKNKTVIENAAQEPEIVNIATYLNNMGAKITGAGTSTIKIVGVDHLGKCFHEVIPDRIEAGTFILSVLSTGGELMVENANYVHNSSLIKKIFNNIFFGYNGDDAL